MFAYLQLQPSHLLMSAIIGVFGWRRATFGCSHQAKSSRKGCRIADTAHTEVPEQPRAPGELVEGVCLLHGSVSAQRIWIMLGLFILSRHDHQGHSLKFNTEESPARY